MKLPLTGKVYTGNIRLGALSVSLAVGIVLFVCAWAQSTLCPDLNDYSKILKVGEEGDRRLIPQLQAIFRTGDWTARFSLGPGAQIALARMGDETAMKSVICEIDNSEAPSAQSDAFRKLEYVKGYTSIRTISRFLENTKANTAPRGHGDMSFGILSDLAREALEHIIQPPFKLRSPMNLSEAEAQNTFWRGWLDQHEAEYRSLTPVFAFDDVPPAECKQIKQEMAAYRKAHPPSRPSWRIHRAGGKRR